MLQVPQALPPESILTALINDLAQHTDELTLILDDYHLIESPTIHQGLQFLLDHQPEQLHLPLISRVDPPLPLSRLRDLFGFRKQKLLPDILLGLALFVLFVVVTYAANPLIYGPALFNTARTQTGHYNPNPLGLPLWFFWWSTLVLPVSVGITEELTYRAYALPRLVALSRRT